MTTEKGKEEGRSGRRGWISLWGREQQCRRPWVAPGLSGGPSHLGTPVKKGCGYSVGKSHKPHPFSCSPGLHLQQPPGQKPVRYRHAGSTQARELTHGGQASIGVQGSSHSLGSKSGMSQVGWHPSFFPQASGFGTLVLPRGGAGVQGTGGSPELQELTPLGHFLPPWPNTKRAACPQ